jgi:hypothetical protein
MAGMLARHRPGMVARLRRNPQPPRKRCMQILQWMSDPVIAESTKAVGEPTMADIKHSDTLYFKEFWDIA